MWMMVLFDLPVTEPEERKAATGFRNFLLDQGFEMAQFSVYVRHTSGKEAVEAMTRNSGGVPAVERQSGYPSIHRQAVRNDHQFPRTGARRNQKKSRTVRLILTSTSVPMASSSFFSSDVKEQPPDLSRGCSWLQFS